MHRSMGCALIILSCALPVSAQDELLLDQTSDPVLITQVDAQANAGRAAYDADALWRSAVLYCEAARLGSSEALYRLGMLYAFGEGVVAHRDYAAALFLRAMQQGHPQARNMLDTLRASTQQLPPCMVQAMVLPERAPPRALISGENGIQQQLAALPANKRWLVEMATKMADWYGIDPELVLSIIYVESNFNVAARSSKEAQGLMQLIPATAERFNVRNAYNAAQNLKGGLTYLRWLLSYYRGDVTLAVAAYNAGEGNVDRYKGIPPFKETRRYVKKVQENYQPRFHPFDTQAPRVAPWALR